MADRSRIENHHAEWLSLVETSGPFLTVPTLKRTLPDGLEPPPAIGKDLRIAFAEWRQDPDLQQRYVRWVLDEVLGLRDAVEEAGELSPAHLVAEHGVTLRPDYVVRDRSREGPPAVLLVHRVGAGTAFDRSLPGEAWAATPIDRAAELARASQVPLGLVTDGNRWTLVWAREGETTGTCTWRSEIWLEEEVTLRAFVTLLGAKRFFNLPLEEGLAALLEESAGKQQEVADQLGAQVRRAVELLITSLDRVDRDRHGALLSGLEGAEVYRGATTVMMRIVFLFVAEERRLLPLTDPRYAETLAASTLRAQLQERADRDGEDPLERSTAGWHRLLALFRAVHGGIEHDELRLPAYGGGLFDPDRYPFLEGRPPATSWREIAADPLPIDDRTILHLLDALQTLDQGGARVLLSYRSLDVEQIGHVYEGLLDHTAIRLHDAALAMVGKHEPELPLGKVEQWFEAGREVLVERLATETGRSAKAIGKALDAELADDRRSHLRAACGGDDSLLERVAPFHELLREDLRGDPLVILPDSLFVTQALDRRASGTYYTPRELAEEVVQYALEPVVYRPGPAEDPDPAKWNLRSAAELLDLKVADIAMGSGAFLVAAGRYLAARLQEAWSEEAPTPAVPADPIEREALAHCLVAERCLYGVDKNPMAVEMAKLSLWLITLAKDRPFSFLDHALRVGDSLLGVTDATQLKVAHLDPRWPRQSTLDLGFDEIEAAVERARALRAELEGLVAHEIADVDRKRALLEEADDALEDARVLGDLIVGAAMTQIDGADPLALGDVARQVRSMLDPENEPGAREEARGELRQKAEAWLEEREPGPVGTAGIGWRDRHPLHWVLEFPEVFAHGGFDAVVGNPPFLGGKKISGALGGTYREYLAEWVAGARGNADLVAYFFLRAASVSRRLGLMATDSIAQGGTREVGLERMVEGGWSIYRAVSSFTWPGGASLEVSIVWAQGAEWSSPTVLDGAPGTKISPMLERASRVEGPAHGLRQEGFAFQGSNLAAAGFVLDAEEGEGLIEARPGNEDVVRPYLSGPDLNGDPRQRPSRYVIDFRDWPRERAERYPEPFELLGQRVREEVLGKAKYPGWSERWWQYWNPRAESYRKIQGLERVLAIVRVSNTVQPVFVKNDAVFDVQLVVFAYEDDGHLGLLTSNFHWWWTVIYASKRGVGGAPRYAPTACFETLPQPRLDGRVEEFGRTLDRHRSAVLRESDQGLTKTYNRVHDPDDSAEDVVRLRQLHVDLDHAVRDAYGWDDLDLDHGFHETKFGLRYTFGQVARQEVLDRLLELNHERYAEEVKQGLHDKPKAKRKRKAVAPGAMTLGFDDD
ncbi:MAG TPA: DNA methyltransferase [Solirubrobacterales bacterium]|nr:DNA methyltransferase [Solirubrobacterales bacterium]